MREGLSGMLGGEAILPCLQSQRLISLLYYSKLIVAGWGKSSNVLCTSGEMNSKTPVSGLIILWNSEKFIYEAIESVFAQIYEHWELLLVDNG